jgi:hypothetical protein
LVTKRRGNLQGVAYYCSRKMRTKRVNSSAVQSVEERG